MTQLAQQQTNQLIYCQYLHRINVIKPIGKDIYYYENKSYILCYK